jgi:hypothetical protein
VARFAIFAISRDGGEIAVGGDRETRFDDIHAHLVEQRGDLQLLVMAHGRAGRLLAIAQGGVEDQDSVVIGHVGISLALFGVWRRYPSPERSRRMARSEAAKEQKTKQTRPCTGHRQGRDMRSIGHEREKYRTCAG